MENKEKVLREKLKKALNRVFDLFSEYEAQFGDYTQKENEKDKLDAQENLGAKQQKEKTGNKGKSTKKK